MRAFTMAALLPLMQPALEAQPVSTIYEASTGIGDAIAVGPSGDIFGCPGRGIETLIRITPGGERSIFSSGHGSPTGIDFDSDGNAFVVNYRQNNVVKIEPDGTTSAFASGLNGPAHVVVSDADEIFVSEFGANFSANGARVLRFTPDGSKFYRIDLDGNVSAFAGGGGSGRRDGLLSASTFPGPNSVAFSADGNTLYVNDAPDGALRAISFTHDTDGDGHSDEQELRAGSNPEEEASVLRISNAVRTMEDMDLRWSSAPGRAYTVEFSPDMGVWEEVGQVGPGDSMEAVFTHGGSISLPSSGFYRIRLR
jgi:DNA-binding beta-propeller fold protein YncE